MATTGKMSPAFSATLTGGGDASAAKQDAQTALLTALSEEFPDDGAFSVFVGSGAAATAEKQDTGNTSLASLDTKLGEVQATPTANTLLSRLKAIADKLGTLLDGRIPIVAATSALAAVEPIVEPAHGAADDSNGPQKIGGKATAAAPAAVDGDDRVNASFDLYGRLRVLQDAGLTPFRSIDLDESEEEVKATAGRIGLLFIANLHATDDRFIKFYNATAANTTVGTTTPVWTIPWKAKDRGWVAIPEGGLNFDTAITVAATTALADADTGAPGAGEVVIALGYK